MEPSDDDIQYDRIIADEPEMVEQAVVQSRVALSIICLLFVFVGLFATVVFLFADDLYLMSRSEAASIDIDRPGGPLQRYRSSPEQVWTNELMRELGTLAFARVEPEPYLESRLWRGLRLTMSIRLAVFLLTLVGVILVLRRRLSGRPVLVIAFVALILLGAIESLAVLRDGIMVVEEYRRDLGNAFRAVTDEVGLSEQFPPMRTFLAAPRLALVRRIVLGYFLLATAIWQIMLIALVLRRPTRLERVPKELS